MNGYLTFSSNKAFSLTIDAQVAYTGVLEYSTDTNTWTEVIKGSAIESVDNKIYLRGSNNTYLCHQYSLNDDYYWSCIHFSGGTDIECSGNIETLLDYNTVLNNQHPYMSTACFAGLFHDCYRLVSAPDLPATNLSSRCYHGMFAYSGLRQSPELPALSVPSESYAEMFTSCNALTTIGSIAATSLGSSSCYRMFAGCNFVLPPQLHITQLGKRCCEGMFDYCRALVAAPSLPATRMADYCYWNMFSGCASLVSAPDLPATTLAEGCYRLMFADCTSLKIAPALPATTLAYSCYNSMFSNCTSLIQAPELPATQLNERCYTGMFYGCSSLQNAPQLPATKMESYCYSEMFCNCIGLTSAPNLPATELALGCYNSMFSGCTNLKQVLDLPATTLARYCYKRMFYQCESLKTLPVLPATTLMESCYEEMFSGCTRIRLSTVSVDKYTVPYRIPSTEETGTDAEDAVVNMFTNTGGPFTGTPDINTIYYLHDGSGYIVRVNGKPLNKINGKRVSHFTYNGTTYEVA